MVKEIRVWTLPAGPNSYKVIIVLEELGIPYTIENVRFEDVKKRPFIDVNPNGRTPAIQDPNTNVTLWESGAILQYLIEQYDVDGKLSYNTLPEKAEQNQWLMFQMSGQGPYFGQAGWFNVLHPTKVVSAIERYNNEAKRILGVLEGHLAKRSWLMGDRITFADIAFAPYNDRVDALLAMPEGQDKFEGFPKVKAWHERITARPSWKKAMELRAKLMDEQGLDWNGMPKGTSNMKEYQEKMKQDEEAA